MKKSNILISLLVLIMVNSSCTRPEVEESLDQEQEGIETTVEDNTTLAIPAGFDFSTYRSVEIVINDPSPYAKYDVYAYITDSISLGMQTYEDQSGQIVTREVFRNDVINKQIYSGAVRGGNLNQTVNVPKFCTQLYIRRNENLNVSAEIVPIIDDKVDYLYIDRRPIRNSGTVTDYLYCVNGSGEHFQVDPLTGELTYLSDMPMGSWTAAIDQENLKMYSIGRSSPYPLMRYDIETGEWDTVANLGIGGPRLDYNDEDGLLYFSKDSTLYTFDPDTGENLATWDIIGIHNTQGGDLAFAEDGTLFLCSFSGLYRLDLDENNDYQSTRISADNLPFQPTSMTFDSNQELWLANSSSSSDLIIMDTQTGGWEYRYGQNAGNGTDFGRTINDLTTFRIFSDTVDDTDSDGDGIPDRDDTFPDDPDQAFEEYTPSRYGTGTVAFEDLWPSRGDYDFNDMALSYQVTAILNAQNLVVKLEIECRVKANSAGFNNGVGIEIEGVSPAQIEGVSGTVLTENYINLNANGTEANQGNAVIILCDKASNFTNLSTITVDLTNPMTTQALGVAPFNPFIIVNGQREKEVHLPNGHKTDLAQDTFDVEGVNADPDGNYIGDNGRPWAISIIHDFKVPKESVSIENAYNYFTSWALSGGVEYTDWYKDNPGYRNDGLLDN
ncbi:LruC domain-containing protein [Aureitalea marina]|uniref:DUF4842 domain-containing protein n=1 Tax=Aureitalea marina TaxID=930804 RepID=A0A2S7KR50_9FLAO|nr:LruC domain-containing protein [Aureitalea marina]PQB05090.1 hypothetical protein BST85_09430 [Aureitalea marina]